MERRGWKILIGCAILVWFPRTSQVLSKSSSWWISMLIPAFFVLAVVHTFFLAYSPFLYFQF